ncbi:MAG TPA: hypothetical protein VHP54_09065 [Caproiciproducens sp.]|nr:hypothetical protein [Caproiciproducens sp.]
MKKLVAIFLGIITLISFGGCWNDKDTCSSQLSSQPSAAAKPVLYLYPAQKTDVNVQINLNGKYTCTYPEYGNGWNVTAYPDGKIVNSADRKEYSYLYWEADMNANYDMSKGFVVKGSDTAEFLQKNWLIWVYSQGNIMSLLFIGCRKCRIIRITSSHFRAALTRTQQS